MKEIKKIDENTVDIDGETYVRPFDEPKVLKLLSDLYGLIWVEAVYDPNTKETEEYSRRLLPIIQELNGILKFKA